MNPTLSWVIHWCPYVQAPGCTLTRSTQASEQHLNTEGPVARKSSGERPENMKSVECPGAGSPKDCLLVSNLHIGVIEVLYDPGILLLSIYLKETKTSNSKRHTHPSVHRSTIYSCQDVGESKCPSTDEPVKKTWYICTLTDTSLERLLNHEK